MFQENEHRQEFRKQFLELIKDTDFGAKITDVDLKTFAMTRNIQLSITEIKQTIWAMEHEIGETFHKRLKRLRNEGYIILEPKAQANLAVQEGSTKIKKVLNKTATRLLSVDTNQLEDMEKKQIEHRCMQINSLLNIIEHSVKKPQINTEGIKLLSTTANNLKVLTAIQNN